MNSSPSWTGLCQAEIGSRGISMLRFVSSLTPDILGHSLDFCTPNLWEGQCKSPGSVILDYGCIISIAFEGVLETWKVCDSWRKILSWLGSGNKSLVERSVLPLRSKKHSAGGVTQRGRKVVQAPFSKAEVLYLSPFWDCVSATYSPASGFSWNTEILCGSIDSWNNWNYIFTSVALCVVSVSGTALEFCSVTFGWKNKPLVVPSWGRYYHPHFYRWNRHRDVL